MPDSPNVKIPYVPEGTLDPAAGLNLAINVIDALLQPRVIAMDLTAPPSTGADGDMYIVAAGATGDWAGKDDWLARYVLEGQFWQFYEPGVQVSMIVNDDDGIFYVYDPLSSPPGWTQVQGGGGGGANAVDIGIFFPGGPPLSNQLIGKFVASRAFTFPADFAGAVGHIGTNPTGSFAITVSVGGASVGTITISAGGAFTFSTSATPVAVGIGDEIEFEAPGSTDLTAADIAFTLVGEV